MPDIFHDFPINAPAERVFRAVSAPAEIDAWWSKTSSGKPAEGSVYELGFGPGYDWQARVSQCRAGVEFELEFTRADTDWTGSRVGFWLENRGKSTTVHFHHTGWPALNEHYRISCFCWAMYLRLLRRYLEEGERVPYEKRLDV